ncbi:hypothetical protein CABS01_10630 [Colletotrichum abscissum]|nr:uncharacterized protein CABS01_10630 [Colletotrichum abscissum]KAK1498855.1 hypothetical protein CABS01_10630 [Colletotrichum abscissum]
MPVCVCACTPETRTAISGSRRGPGVVHRRT